MLNRCGTKIDPCGTPDTIFSHTILCSLFAFCEDSSALHAFFISNTFISNARLKFAKNQAKAKPHPEAELLLFDNYSLSPSTLSSKNNRRYSEKYAKNKCVWLMTMKMRLEMKNRSHRYEINRSRHSHRHTYTKYKMYLSMMLVICIKHHLSNIWSSIHEKVKQRWLRLSWKKALLI